MECFYTKDVSQENDMEIDRCKNKIAYLTEILAKVIVLYVKVSEGYLTLI